jgi:hypothetical protein
MAADISLETLEGIHQAAVCYAEHWTLNPDELVINVSDDVQVVLYRDTDSIVRVNITADV